MSTLKQDFHTITSNCSSLINLPFKAQRLLFKKQNFEDSNFLGRYVVSIGK
jgi:hypothetical protein